ncbi:MAG: phosphatidate cytidylyltransferase [Deltaproteobacteria bacterium]|nr:phosphatidate cytidylyltransferase [Deltaproteobacteria bacterium]
MHFQRWLTALILLPLLILLLLKGGLALFVLVILAVNGLAQWEFLGIFQIGVDHARRTKAILIGSLLLLSFCLVYPPSQFCPPGLLICNPTAVLLVLVWCLFVLFLFYLLSYGHIESLSHDLAVNILGLLYLPFLLGHLIWLRFLPQGEWWVLWFLLVIFAGDTGAFYTGRTFGKTKLYPAVSPGKTWAGVVGGLAASLAVGVLAGRWFMAHQWLVIAKGLPALAILALVLAVVGLLGDLFESMLKRQMQVKDASHLLPGHGGMLDRLDSILFTAPVVVYARLFLLG